MPGRGDAAALCGSGGRLLGDDGRGELSAGAIERGGGLRTMFRALELSRDAAALRRVVRECRELLREAGALSVCGAARACCVGERPRRRLGPRRGGCRRPRGLHRGVARAVERRGQLA